MSSSLAVVHVHEQSALDLALARLPHKPYCTDDLAAGLYIRPALTALKKAYIQLDPPGRVSVLIFDVDREQAAFSWNDAGLPPPSWTAMSPDSGRAHIAYVLEAPVWTGYSAAAARYAESVYRAYRDKLGADTGYARLVTKSPWSGAWRTTVWRAESYTLSELADYVDLSAGSLRGRLSGKLEERLGVGRNAATFESLRHWSYAAIAAYWRPAGYDAWYTAVLDEAERIAQNVCAGDSKGMLPWSEIKATAKSVARWTWKRLSPAGRADLIARTHTSELQAARGRRSGEVRRAGSVSESKPWVAEGVSRATWYRRRQA